MPTNTPARSLVSRITTCCDLITVLSDALECLSEENNKALAYNGVAEKVREELESLLSDASKLDSQAQRIHQVMTENAVLRGSRVTEDFKAIARAVSEGIAEALPPRKRDKLILRIRTAIDRRWEEWKESRSSE